jgi:S-DNA-T family DNA segregation ATPase FtsK/SpoIIIE
MLGDFVAAGMSRLSGAVPPGALWPLAAMVFFILGAGFVWSACGLSVGDFLLAFYGAEHKKAGAVPGEFHEPGPGGVFGWLTRLVRWLSDAGSAPAAKGPREFWMTGARTEPTLARAPAAKPVKKEAAVVQVAGTAEVPPPATSVLAKKVASALAAAAEKRQAPLTAAEDLAGFQLSPYRGHKPGGDARNSAGDSQDTEESASDSGRMEPFFGPRRSSWFSEGNGGSGGRGGSGGQTTESPFLRLTAKAAQAAGAGAQKLLSGVANGAKSAGPLMQASRARRPAAAEQLDGLDDVGAALPPLSLLAHHQTAHDRRDALDPALMGRAEALASVLADFGVRGRISGIYPGPVITLFELEPVRGTKSSRVVSLADDIARSMSAVSARIAVVPGRDAIGIELPNPRREIVGLREILESSAFQNSQAALPLALGKTIGGEPIAVDLARMPHLLIAGTTGSGKSVGINTMILSLLYRLPASQCNFIMIDPKMLELSVYDGIPHLLAPVVTDPRKAVAALKWAVKEMNSRYERMSRLGVRNVTSYNAKAAAAQLRGQPLKRTIQTGFHPVTGEPIEEEEVMEAVSMPYLVIVIDEMADLMMCAGKDVEFAVQRLSQMARAAGIHLIMATQRPSVDVVTGTIKANFPSRISFQVTSKIDSRTIIGEQGAEQLLGMGDMLYMASGGRIMRAHGPFVTDDEVEAVARHLKAQGFPTYRDDILEDAGGFDDEMSAKGGNGKGGDLYGQAVEIVLKDRKPTASYLQRRLNIGYNRAASLIERMEEEGIVGAPGRTGRREILADAGQ